MTRLRARIGRRPWVLLAVIVVLLTASVMVLEFWATPSGWLLPARRVIVPALHWAKEHLLNAAAISAMAGVGAVVIPIVLWRLDQRRQGGASEQVWRSQRQANDRSMMRQRVRNRWITEFLYPSLEGAPHLRLGFTRRRDLIDRGIPTRRSRNGSPRPLQSGISISQVFDQAGGALLILGEPGTGKTTLLLELADELRKRAEHEPDQRVPVVLNLASWARQRQPLTTWLVHEIANGYDVSVRTAMAWIQADELVLLLDGLDEVAEAHRSACAEAINTYRREHGLVPIAVCSRTQELRLLGPLLRMEEAVELQPPGDQEIEYYLRRARGISLAEVSAALARDQELRALLRSPLMLRVVALAYEGEAAPALPTSGTLGQRQARLWQAYVERMFEQRPLDRSSGYTREQALARLGWLARALQGRDQTEFHLDRLTPDWLLTPVRRRLTRLVAWLAMPLLGGFPAGLWLWLYLAWHIRISGGDPMIGAAVGPPLVVLVGLIAGRKPRPAEEIQFVWPRLRRGLRLALVLVLIVVVLSALVAYIADELAFILAIALTFVVFITVRDGVTAGLREERTAPNEGIRRSARYALVGGLLGGSVLGLLVGLVIGLIVVLTVANVDFAEIPRLAYGLTVVVATVLFVGPLGGLAIGLRLGGAAWIQHYTVRAALVIAGFAPWRHTTFLDAMDERLLLRRSGGAYLFIHRLLRDHLAERGSDGTPAHASNR